MKNIIITGLTVLLILTTNLVKAQCTAGTITAINDTICLGTPGSLTLSGNSSNIIQWQSSVNDSDFTDIIGATDTTKYKTPLLSETTFYRAIVGPGGCDTSQALELFVPPALTISFTTVDSGFTVYFTNTSSGGVNVRYTWDFGDGTSSTEANPVHIYQRDSIYQAALLAIDGSNCTYVGFKEIDIPATGVKTIALNIKASVYPNPFTEITAFNVAGIQGEFNITLTNVLGEKVQELNRISNTHFQINRNNLTAGIYFYSIFVEGKQVANGKLVVE